MIKPITKSPVIKSALIGTMMAGMAATGSFAANNRNASESTLPQYSEISSAASSATRAAAMVTPVTQQKSRNVNHKTAGDYFVDFADTPEKAADLRAFVNEQHEELGLYGATVDLQLRNAEIGVDRAIISYLIEKMKLLNDAAEAVGKNELPNLDFLPLYDDLGGSRLDISKESIQAAAKHFDDDIITPAQDFFRKDFPMARRAYYNMAFSSYVKEQGRKGTAEEVNAAIEVCLNDMKRDFAPQMEEYHKLVNKFDAAQNGSKTPEQKANLIAYKLYLIDAMLVRGYFTTLSFFRKQGDFADHLFKNFYSKIPKPIK